MYYLKVYCPNYSMYKLTQCTIRFLICIFFLFPLSSAASPVYHGERYQPVEILLEAGRNHIHPHRDVKLYGQFISPEGKLVTIRGYWDGGNIWRLRFAAPTEGEWHFTTTCSDTTDSGLHHREGIIRVTPYTGDDPFARKGWLKVSDTRRYLTYGDGTPFFWLADTAWEIGWKSRMDEMLRYLDDRQAKGFNVIQMVAGSHQFLHPFGVQNRTGAPFFLNDDFSMPNPRYFDYLDTIIISANTRGIALAMTPLWAAMNILHFDARYQQSSLSIDDPILLAQYIGARYAGYNVIWIIAGDNAYDTPAKKAFWTAFARELRASSGPGHLVTLHPRGWTSSFDFFDNQTDWIDFNIYQSSHTAGAPFTYMAALKGYQQRPVKPVLNDEAVYEDIYHNLWQPGDNASVNTFRIRPEHIRQASYESILSGALVGMTYGANGIWQWSTVEMPGTHTPRVPVDQAIAFPGSVQMGVLKNLMTTYGWYDFVPSRSVLRKVIPGDRYVPLAQNEQYMMGYLSQGTQSVTLNPDPFVQRLTYAWIKPETGETSPSIPLPSTPKTLSLKPPDGHDWVLLITHKQVFTSFDDSVIPGQARLYQNLPNPFNPITVIRYELPVSSQVTVSVYT